MLTANIGQHDQQMQQTALSTSRLQKTLRSHFGPVFPEMSNLNFPGKVTISDKPKAFHDLRIGWILG